jgi:hypothetical protein
MHKSFFFFWEKKSLSKKRPADKTQAQQQRVLLKLTFS